MSNSQESFSPEYIATFTERIKEEIKHKDYKVLARAAYDDFGQRTAQNSARNKVTISKAELKQRDKLVSKMKQVWFEGVSKRSLLGFPIFRRNQTNHTLTITNGCRTIEALSLDLESSYEKLQTIQLFKESYMEMRPGIRLLILGDPGSGKTTALLKLAQRLISDCEQNLALPLPVVLNLSSWARNRKRIVDWVIDEMREKYQVRKALSDYWIRNQQLIFLLDGLDEVLEPHRNDCILALNEFICLFPQTEGAICSRFNEYKELDERLLIGCALVF
jgi:predicted NACHT family NTPase